MTPLLNIILIIVIPIIVVTLSKVFEKKERGLGNNFEDLFVEKQQALAGIVDEKISEVKDNAIDLEIAVKRAGIISKAIEEDLAKLTPRIESYKDYEAAISQYQGQVEVLEDAYLEILNRVDTILKERHTIDKTYKRISDVKTKVLELEGSVGLIQDNLVKSYRDKFDEFEGELYKRFDLLTSNLLARDAHYSSIAEQEKEKISELTEDFKNHVSKKEEMFTNQLTSLAERAARNNIEQLSGLFEKSREELFVRYDQFADEVNLKSVGIENRYEDLNKSGITLEEELYDLRSSIRDRLNNITETSTLEFKTEMQKTKDTLLASLKEEVEKLGLERDEFLDSIDEKASILEKDLDSMKERSHKLDEDYIAKATEIEATFNELKTDINDRVSKEIVVFSDHIKDVLENESTGVVTIYNQKTKELNELTDKIDDMSRDTLSKANARFDDIIVEINVLRDDAVIKAQDDLDNALDKTRTSIINSINDLNKDIENESDLLKEKIGETNFQTNEILSILENKKEKILDEIKLEKEYVYKDLEEHSNGHLAKLEDEFNSMRATVCEDIDLYIEKTTKDILLAEEKMSDIENKFNSTNDEIDKLLADTEGNIKEKLEKKIDLLETITYELEKDVHDINSEFASKTMEAYNNIDTFKNEIESYGLNYVGQIKSELDNMFDNYKDTQVKEIVEDMDSVIGRIELTEKRCDDVQNILSKNFTDLQNEMQGLLEDTKNESDANKKSILDLLGTELKNATLDFDNMLNLKRDEMNILKGELEDVSHRAESGKEVFEKNMQNVYDVVEKKEKELLSSVEEKYLILEHSLEDILKEKKEHINDLNSSYHSMFENTSKNLMDQFASLKADSNNLSDDYKEKLDSMGKRIEGLNNDASNIKELIDTQFETINNNTINLQNNFEKFEAMNESLSKKADEVQNKVDSLDSEIESVKEDISIKASDMFMRVEDNVFNNITELRGLVDGAIARYKDEISELEHHRSVETDSVIEEIKESLANQEAFIANNSIGEEQSKKIKEVVERLNAMETEFNNFASNLESDNPEVLESMLDKIKLEISELDSGLHNYVDEKIVAVEESVSVLSDKNDDGIEDIVDRILAVDEKQDSLAKNIDERFDKVNEALVRSDSDISNYKASMDSLILDYEASLEEKIKSIEMDINKITSESSSVFETEINSLKNYIEANNDNIDENDIFEKINELRENFISSIEKLESKTGLLTDEQNHLMDLLDVLRSDVLESVKDSFDSKENEIDKKLVSLKEEIVESIPSMSDIATLFETEKESMYEDLDKMKEDLEDSKKFESIFEDEKNKFIEDLDNFKSIIRAETLGFDDKTSLLINNIESRYKDILNEEKKNWTEGFDSLMEKVNSFNEKISSNDSSVNDIVSEKVANEKVLFEEKINSILENMNKPSSEDLVDLINKEKADILSNLELFKEDIAKTFSSVDNISLLFSEEQNGLSEKFNSLKDALLKDMPNLEDISKFLIEGEDKVQVQFDNFREDILSKMPAIKEELQEEIDSIMSGFRDSVDEKRDSIENELTSFKDTISMRVEFVNEKTEELENDKEKILNDIEVLRHSINDDKVSSEDVYSMIQSEKEDILVGMEDFKESILSLAKDQSNSLSLVEDEREKLLDSIEALKNDLGLNYFKKDEIVNFFEEQETDVNNIFDNLKKEILNNTPDLASLAETFKGDVVSLFEESNNLFKDRIEKRVEHFEDSFSDASQIKDFYRDAVTEEVLSLREQANSSLESLHEKMDNAREELDKIENEKIKDIVSRVDEARENVTTFIETIKEDIVNQESEIKNLIESVKEDTNNKTSEILSKLEDDVSSNITELRGLVDGAIARYKDEISELEHHRSVETDSVIEEIKESLANQEAFIANNSIGEEQSKKIKEVVERLNAMETEFNNFASNLESDNPEVLESMLDKIKLEISELDSGLHNYVDEKIVAVEESVSVLSDKNDDGIEDIVDRILAVDEKQDSLAKNIDERFDKVNEALVRSDSDISNYKASMDSLILDYEASLEEKIKSIEMDINKITSESSSVFETEINSLKNYIEANNDNIDENDIFEKINELRENFISSIEKLESKTGLLTDEQNHLMDLLDVLRSDVLESVKDSFDSKENEIDKKLVSLKEEIVESIPSMSDIATLFETEKESMYEDLDKMKEDLEDSKKFESIFEDEKNKFIEDLDNFKSIIRAETLGFDDKTSLLINNIESRYKDILNEEKKNWTEGFDSLMEKVNSFNEKISSNDSSVNDIVSEKVANEKVLFEEKINSILENMNKPSSEDLVDLINKEKADILSNLELFKEDIAKTFSSVDNISLLFSEEQNGLSEKFNSLKDALLKDMPNLEDISKFLIEGEDKVQVQFDNFREDILSKMPAIKEELQEEIDSIMSGFRDSVDEKRDSIENELTSFKDTISMRVEFVNEKTEELENDKEKILNDIEVLRHSINDDKVSSEDVYSMIQSEKEDILVGMEDFKESILSLAKDQSNSLSLVEDEREKLLDSIEALKNDLGLNYFKKDEIVNFFEEQETDVNNIFDNLKKEILNNTPDLASLAETFKGDVVSLFEESNNLFKDRIEKRVEHFEDSFSDASQIKDFYRDAVTEEVLSLREQANSSLESLHEKMDNAREELDKIENEKIKDIVSRVDEARENVTTFIETIKEDIVNQESEIKNLIEIQKGIKTEIDDIRKERQDLVKFIDNSEGDIKLQIDKLTDKIVVATDIAQERINEKENELASRVEETERYLLSIESKLTSAHQLHLEESRNKIDDLLNTFNDEVSREIVDLKPNIEKLVNDFLREELDSFKDFTDAKAAVEKLENLLVQKIDDMFTLTEDKVSKNMKDIEVRLSDYQNILLDEFNNSLNIETENSKDKMETLQNDSLANLKVFYENSERSYSEKHNEKLNSLHNIFSNVEDDYKNKIESFTNEINMTKNNIVSSVEDTIADLQQALTLKDMFIDGIEENQKDVEKIEARIKTVENELEPSIQKLENIIKEKIDNIYEQMDEAKTKVETGGKEFKENLKDINSKFLESFNERLKKVDDIIEDTNLKSTKSIDEISSRVDAVLDEKSSQFDALKAHYEGMSDSLEALRESITEAINNRITEANDIIDEGVAGIESKSEEKYEKYIERLNSNLEQTLSILMKDAKEYIHEAKESILKDSKNDLIETGEKLSDMTNIVSNLEKTLEEYGQNSEYRLQALDIDIKDKTNILMNDLAKKTEDINEQVTGVIESINTLSKHNKNNIESEYDSLKEKIDSIAYKVDSYLSDMKVFDNADAMTENIKNEIENLRVLLSETNEGKESITQTVAEFSSLKDMHTEILEYANNIKNEKAEIEDTEEKVKMLIELSDDMKEKFTSIAEYNSKIETTELGVKAVLDLSNDIEDKLSSLKDKETVIVATLDNVETIEKQTFDIFSKINDIQHKLNDVEDNRNILMDKLQTVEQDAAKLHKNDKKIQTLISRIEQLEVLIDEIGNQRDTLMKMKTYYQDQDSKVENNLERADYAINSLEALLKNVDQYLFEDGIPLVKPTNKKVQYKGADSKKEKLIVDLYKTGWTVDQIVSHNNYSREDVEATINGWKRKSSNNQ